MNPVCDLLEPLVENPKEALFGDLIAKKPRRTTKKVTTVEDLFKAYKDKK